MRAEELLKATAGDVNEKAAEARTRVTPALERARATYQEMQDQGIASAREAVKRPTP